MFMGVLAVYNVLLAKYTGQEDIIVGTPVSGRSRQEVQDIVGVFINTLPMRNRPRTDISFVLPVAGPATIEIYAVTGRRVRRLVQSENYAAGHHKVTWYGADDSGQAQSSGIYLYKVRAEGQTLGGKMAMIR